MEITEVKVFPVSEEKLKAFVSIVFDRCFMVNDIKIIQGRDGLFISMPSRKKKNGEFKDVAHPLNNDCRRVIEAEVVAEYERVLAERGQSLPAPARTFPDTDGEPGEGGMTAQDGNGLRPAPKPARAARDGAVREEAARDGGGEEEEKAAQGETAAASGKESGEGGEAEASNDDKEDEEKSLEEVQEMHLRDSFWSMS